MEKGDTVDRIGTNPWPADVLAAFAALAPIAVGWIYRVFIHPRPFWVEFYDPETIHFYAGLEMLRGHVSPNTDNPATPLQMLSATIESIGRMSTLDFDRFRFPAYLLGGALIAVGAVLFVRFVAAALPFPLRVASVWVYFLAPHALIYAAVWSPEILYFFTGSLALAAIVRSWAGYAGDRVPEVDSGPSRRAIFVAGAAIGLTCSIKFVFLGWVPAFLASLLVPWRRPWPSRLADVALASAGAVAGFVLFTLPVISKYPAMFSWVTGIVTESGFYGHGGVGLPSAAYVLGNAKDAVVTGKVFHLVFLAAIVMLALAARCGSDRSERILAVRAFVFVAISSALTYAIVMKHFNHRYLLPAALASALAFVLGIRWLAAKRRAITWGVAVVMLLLVVKTVRHDMRTHDEAIRRAIDTRASVESFIARDAAVRKIDPVIIYGDFPTPSFALRYFATESDLAVLDREFPREGTWGTNLFGGIHLPPGVQAWNYFVVQQRQTELYPLSFDWLNRERTPKIVGTFIIRRGVDLRP